MLDVQEYPEEQDDLVLMGYTNQAAGSALMVMVCTRLGSKHVVRVPHL